MWRMALVAVAVVMIYATLGRHSPWTETFGEPWTLSELLSALEEQNAHLGLEPAAMTDEYDLAGASLRRDRYLPVLFARGQQGEFSGYVLVFPTVVNRVRAWPERGGPVTPDGGTFNLEGTSFPFDNVVIFRSAASQDSYGPDFTQLSAAINAIVR